MSSSSEIDTPTPAAKGTHGGKRTGAGRKVRAHVEVVPGTPALDFLTQVYESPSVPLPLRIASAKAVIAATVARPGAEREGKKAAQQRLCDEAYLPGGSSAPGGKFAPSKMPLHVVQMIDAKKAQER